jgi:hypothetical protein
MRGLVLEHLGEAGRVSLDLVVIIFVIAVLDDYFNVVVILHSLFQSFFIYNKLF